MLSTVVVLALKTLVVNLELTVIAQKNEDEGFGVGIFLSSAFSLLHVVRRDGFFSSLLAVSQILVSENEYGAE